MALDWSAFVTGILLMAILVAFAAALGWLAARLLLHAARAGANDEERR